ncbi:MULTISPECIES: TIGR02647 family protein [Motilimonas]|uniref:TIGR02647 family protein n=1 Tax=Motilimonas cestriensis TaxID=2742685 RepID=A0ABS8WF05_9GAMM|nr:MULTISPECIES: TIGR02647 family protein [Motilimonas]MCE0557710.1 TIGR02647 family protein [Motilimonas sp. E26]MCE2597070.1 TIGR02647 family protein [Motilimonas cestriensis]MDO6525982.1 TIGR02647 family protein [Motilimonas sp. 1_MG-2023]
MKGAEIISVELVNDLKILSCFNTDNHEQGIKIHSECSPELAVAAKRLFDKGLITRDDGGYLTDIGAKTAENLEALLISLR